MGGLGEAPTKAFRAPPRFSLSSSSFSEHPQLSSSFHHPASLGERSVALIFGVLRASHFSGSSRNFLTLGAKVRNCCCCCCRCRCCCCCSGFCCCLSLLLFLLSLLLLLLLLLFLLLSLLLLSL